MNKFLLLISLILLCACSQAQDESIIATSIGVNYSYGIDADAVFVDYEIGQSNSPGTAESSRLNLTRIPQSPTNVKIYYKTSYASTDNGDFYNLVAGSLTAEPGASGTRHTFGGYQSLATKLSVFLNKKIYIINGGRTSIALQKGLSSPDWSPSSVGGQFDISTKYYFTVAINKIKAANPGKQIVVFKCWHQGEQDALDNTATANYYNNFLALDAAMSAYDPLLANGIWMITKLNFNQSANETTINSAFQTFVNNNPSRAFLINIDSYPRKVDLTTAQKGGYTPTLTDDNHSSYLAQIAKGKTEFNTIINKYGLVGDSTESSTNTGYNPSSISSSYIRLQMTSGRTTVSSTDNSITAIVNDLSGVLFTPVNRVYSKVDKKKGCLWFSEDDTNIGRFESTVAVGSTLFSNSFSFSAWIKPRVGTPLAETDLIHDIASTGTPNNSQMYIGINTSGTVDALYAVGGVFRSARSASTLYASSAAPDDWIHLAVTFQSGGLIKIYFNGVLQTIDGATNPDLSALTMASYANATNKLQIGARKTGASTYNRGYIGLVREVTLQPVVYSTTDIANLMLN